MADSTTGAPREAGTGSRPDNAIRFRWWNLLLALPLLMLVTALYNSDEPRILGLPTFYWVQFAFVFVGVACVATVYAMTKESKETPPGPADAGSSAGTSGPRR